MKITSAAALMALALWLTGVSAGYAQSPAQPTPTTRILAIGTINQGADLAAARAILPTEVRETVKLYRSVVFAPEPGRRRVHSECHRCCGSARDARKAAPGAGASHDLRTDPAWPAQSAS